MVCRCAKEIRSEWWARHGRTHPTGLYPSSRGVHVNLRMDVQPKDIV